MPDGGDIEISCRVSPSISSKSGDKKSMKDLQIIIKDQGIGMTNEEAKDIFDLFYTTRSNGTGLGLAIVKRIVKSNQWQIEVESTKNEGTTFTLIIPNPI
jgi:signal transduction histidine kinase